MKSSGDLTEDQLAALFTEALRAVEMLDSDGDGHSNLEEIAARTFPGDPKDHPGVR